MNKVEIKVGGNRPGDAEITLNGTKLNGVFHYSLSHDVEGFPVLVIHMYAEDVTVELERVADTVSLAVAARERKLDPEMGCVGPDGISCDFEDGKILGNVQP